MSAEIAHRPAGRSGKGGSRKALGGALGAVLLSLPACVWLWGFTVDDALITARVAAHYAQGLGPRFNAPGAFTDAVTPLGYAPLLGLLARGNTLSVFRFAKWFGLAAWLLTAGLLGGLVARSGTRVLRFSPLCVVAVSAPLAAWAVSGMETGFVTLLATLGVAGGTWGAAALGVAAALRPELIPFAGILVAARVAVDRPGRLVGALRVGCVVAPVVLCASLRQELFGQVVPLSFYAKPSDFAHGLRYALGGFAFTGLPWLLLATPRELSLLPRAAWPLLLALLGHAGALVLCGGDWMPFYRLAVPVLPATALLAALLAEQARPAFAAVRLVVAVAAALVLAVGLGPAARQVGFDRARLIAAAVPVLAKDERIAALDVGWVGAASEAELLDLAGVTDPQVAFFPGGHTSKRIPASWLFARGPTAIVLLLARGAPLEIPYETSLFARAVEGHVARLVAGDFQVRTTLALGEQTYVVLEPKLGP